VDFSLFKQLNNLIMAAKAGKKIKVSSAILAKLQGAQFVQQSPVYEKDVTLVTVPSGDYTFESKNIAATATNKAWTCHEAKFTVNEQEFVIRYRSGIKPNEDTDLVIATFTALRNWPSDSDIRIAKGIEAIFAING
jgi:hypothetical protein